MVVCKNCGKENQPHYKFCLYCGSDITPDPRPGESAARSDAERREPERRAEARKENATLPARGVASADMDAGETPLPTPRPPPVRFSSEVATVSRPGLGPGQIISFGEPRHDTEAGRKPAEAARDADHAQRSAAPADELPAGKSAGTPARSADRSGAARTADRPGGAASEGSRPAKAPVEAGKRPDGAERDAEAAPRAETALRPELPAKVCPTCKALVPAGFQFCGQCGGKVDGPSTGTAPTGGPGRRGVETHPAPRLVLIRPDGSEGGSFPLTGGVNLLGRGSGPLFDADSYLSPLHLQIEVREPPYFVLRDAGSLNGVFIKLTEEEPVSDEAVFRIGQELLRFDAIRMPRPLEDGTEVMGSPNPGYWGRIAIIIGRGQDGSCFPLFGDAVVLGRERGDILFAEDGYVSGTHARISYRHGQVFLQDLASSNGTFLKIRGERSVRSGTYILMGQQLFRVLSS